MNKLQNVKTDMRRTSFRFSYRLLVGQSVGELLKLSDDSAVPLGPCRDVTFLIVVQEARDAGLGGFCGDFFRGRGLDSQGWIELDVHDQVSGVFEGQHRKDRFGHNPRWRPFEFEVQADRPHKLSLKTIARPPLGIKGSTGETAEEEPGGGSSLDLRSSSV